MALQEFLATYAVKVDEDGARRLQRILEQNRSSGAELAEVFASAQKSLAALKKELSETSGLKNVLSGLFSGSAQSSGSSSSNSGTDSSSSSGSLSVSTTSSLSALLSASSVLSISADLTEAEEALSEFKTRLETDHPKLNVDATGITTAVSAAIASVRAMISSVKIELPVTLTLDSSGLNSDLSGITDQEINLPANSSGSSGNSGSVSPSGSSSVSPSGSGSASGSSGSRSGASIGSSSGSSSNSSGSRSGSSSGSSGSGSGSSSGNSSRSSVSGYAAGGRVDSPTLAMIAEEGDAEYVIPINNESRAIPLLKALLSELSSAARQETLSTLLSDLPSSANPEALSTLLSDLPSSANPEALSSLLNSLSSSTKPDDLSSLLSELPSSSNPESLPSSFEDLSASEGQYAQSPFPNEPSPSESQDYTEQPEKTGSSKFSRFSFMLPRAVPANPVASAVPAESASPAGPKGSVSSATPSGSTAPAETVLSEVLRFIFSSLNDGFSAEEPASAPVSDSIAEVLQPAISSPVFRDNPSPSEASVSPNQASLTTAIPGISSSLSALPSPDDFRSVLADLVSAAQSSFLPAGSSSAPSSRTVQAPVNIHITSSAAAPEAVARSVYDIAQRSLLKTLKGVFV